MWHALALVALGLARIERMRLPALLIGVGTALFSGSLYLMALTGARWLGMVTPLGGAAMIAGWLVLAVTALRRG